MDLAGKDISNKLILRVKENNDAVLQKKVTSKKNQGLQQREERDE